MTFVATLISSFHHMNSLSVNTEPCLEQVF